MPRHLILTLIGLLFMALIGLASTFIVGKSDAEIAGSIEEGKTSLSSFVSSIIDRINN